MTAGKCGAADLTRSHAWHAALRNNGWAHIRGQPDDEKVLQAQVLALASELGVVVLGRGCSQVERLVPRHSGAAFARSLSATYGLGKLPLHVDTSHWSVPGRHLVLACVDPGEHNAQTIFCDRRSIALTNQQERLVKSAVFHVQNGRQSFYASICGSDVRFIRYDPGCMKPVSPEAPDALLLFSFEAVKSHVEQFTWVAGDIIVIDNWRMLHGRVAVKGAETSRILLR